MKRELRFTDEAEEQLETLKASRNLSGEYKQVCKALGYLEINPAHPSLRAHEFTSLSTKDVKVFEAYAQNNTPGAYRIFWRYGPDEGAGKRRIAILTILSVVQHPDD